MKTVRKATYVSFSLGMPSNNSWNGKWSGEGRAYVICRRFAASAAGREAAEKVLKSSYYSHAFGDGWRAGISVQEVDAKGRAKLMRNSAGFCGYDWMVDSILRHGAIYASDNLPKEVAA